MNTTTVKKVCKCWKCEVTLNVGDVAKWHKHSFSSVGTHGHTAKNYVRWEMECVDGLCGQRLLGQQSVKQVNEEQKKAQEGIDTLRNEVLINLTGDMHAKMVGMIDQMIANHAKNGIVVF